MNISHRLTACTLSCLVALLGTAAPSPGEKATEGQPVVLARSYTLPSKILEQQRRINVYVPPGYETGDRRYPVLYLLDGGTKEDFFHIAGIASLAADYRNIREFILVGIEGIDRYHDLTPPSEVAQDRKQLPTSGGSAKFRAFLEKELVPYVSSHFRLTDESVLIGESAAGLFVTETLLRQPELFGGYIAISPSLWWNDQALAKASAQSLQAPAFPKDRRLYLTIADEGGTMRAGVDMLVAALKAHAPKEMTWTFVPMTEETHATTFHPAALDAVRIMFAGKKAETAP
ncbi:Alpha/beta hydrolase [Sulfidibacter corallicola]|uniref:Alpha/beta hydrolase n=1 Tax=Sulfidibacter corallicola TaxID=2818388 RepID=A0A8A4TFC8_SULCO|nr:alpha/beta hydrolase-fold protein [Sulfidibacter corallicola]QTD48656.1 alpha/beta hydrolase [Sulfidibacter corallicola]